MGVSMDGWMNGIGWERGKEGRKEKGGRGELKKILEDFKPGK